MKRKFIKPIVLLFLSVLCSVNFSMAQVGPVVSISETMQSLPGEIKTFLSTYFPQAQATAIEMKTMAGYYDIKLDNGYDLEFQTSGAWKEIEAPGKTSINPGIVEALLPDIIYQDLKKNRVEDKVREMEFDAVKGYKIDTGKKKDFYYDINGILLQIQDVKKDKKDKRDH